MYREFILGNNQTGLLTNTSTTAVGGENPSLLLGPNNILPGEVSIIVGSGTGKTSRYAAPSATIASWNSFFASVVASESAAAASASAGEHATSDGVRLAGETKGLWVAASMLFTAILWA